eukprot:tig00000880_g5171.t1
MSAGDVHTLLPYVPGTLFVHALQQLRELGEGSKAGIITKTGAALFLDVSGFSALARSLARSDAASAADQLSSTLNAYFLQLVSCLHARGAEILVFAGDALVAFVAAGELEGGGRGRTLREAAALAVEAARDAQAIAFERNRQKLTAHTGVGAGELHLFLLHGSERAAQALYAGDVIVQVCAAQRASREREIVLSAECLALLQPGLPAEPLQLPAPGPRPLHRLLPSPPAPRPQSPTPAPSGGAEACGCGAPLRAEARAAEAALAPYAEQLLLLAPGSSGTTRGASSSRTTSAPSSPSSARPAPPRAACPARPPEAASPASFPELDAADLSEAPSEAAAAPGGRVGPEPGSPRAATARHAARFGQVVRSVHRVAEELGGSVNKILLDDKGASAIIGFGLPGGFAHEDDAERAVRAALALQAWFRESAAPFACGIAAGRTFCGTLGAPCRKEYALIGDAVILAARLMGRAREAIGAGRAGETAGGAPLQEVLCDQSILTGVTARGRSTGVSFDALPPAHFKGFAEAVPSSGPPGRRPPQGWPPRKQPLVPPPLRRQRRDARPRPGAAAQRHPASLLGRDAELERAAEAVEALAARGRGSTLVVEAEAGMGKTRLLREVQRACAARGVLVLSSAASAVEEATPLWALRGLVASVADASSGEALRADLERRQLLVAPEAALLWESLFDTSASSAGAPPAPAPERGGRQAASVFGVGLLTRVAAALARLISALEQSPPPPPPGRAPGASPPAGPTRVCLLLEDFQWSDSVSWFVVRCIRDSCPSLLLVLTARPMADPPRDYLLLSGQLEEAAGAPGPPGAASGPGSLRSLPSPFSSAKSVTLLRTFDSPSAPASPVSRPLPPHPLDPGPAALSLQGALPPALEPLPELRATGAGARLPPLRAPARVLLLRLGPIDRAAAHALLMALSSAMSLTWPPGAVERVLDKAGGVPLFLVELCRQHATLPPDAAPDAAFEVPDTIQQIVLARVDQLPSHAHALLKLLAVAGSDFSCEQALAADPSGLGAPALRRAFRTLRRAGLIAEVGGSEPASERAEDAGSVYDDEEEGSEGEEGKEGAEQRPWPAPQQAFCFLHALLRDAVYAGIPSGLRVEVHGRLARWLEEHRPDEPAAIALHWRAAGEPERALVHLERAARAAARANALREARRLFGELIAAIDDLELCGPAAFPPLPASLRPPPRRRAGASGGARGGGGAGRGGAEAGRWRAVRAGALRHLALALNYSGDFDEAGEAAEACLLTLGEPMPRSRIGPAAALGIYLRAWRAAGRVGRAGPGGRGSHWLHAPESDGQREALLEALLILFWTGLLKESFGGRGGFAWVTLALVRAFEIVEGLPRDRLGLAECRVWANFSTLLDAVGFSAQGAALLVQAQRLAERLDVDAARAACDNHAGMQLCRAGNFAEGARRFRAASGVASPQPNNHELLAAAAVPLLVTGRLAEARRSCEEAAVFASRLGAGSYGAFLAALVGAFGAVLAGGDEEAAALLRQAQQGVAEYKAMRWWILEILRAGKCLLAWRAGRLADALAHAEASVAIWRAERATMSWVALLLPAILLEFSLWSEAGPGPGPGPGPAWPTAEEAAEALRRAERLARSVQALLEETRLLHLRAAAAGLSRLGLRPFEVAARLRLARAEPEPAAATAALAAALRLAAETGVRVPALGRPAPPPGEFESTWL